MDLAHRAAQVPPLIYLLLGGELFMLVGFLIAHIRWAIDPEHEVRWRDVIPHTFATFFLFHLIGILYVLQFVIAIAIIAAPFLVIAAAIKIILSD